MLQHSVLYLFHTTWLCIGGTGCHESQQVSEVGGPGHFKATSNDRLKLMYKEGCEFARRLENCGRQIKAVESATAGSCW